MYMYNVCVSHHICTHTCFCVCVCDGVHAYLLLQLQEAYQVGGVQVVFVVAVGEHEQVQVPPCGHHLVEGAELLKVQRALVVISVCFLEEPTKDSSPHSPLH